MRLYYYYDREADIFYFSNGKPSSRDKSREAKNDIILRFDGQKKIKGFTILNFAKRSAKRNTPISLPIEAELAPV